MNTPFGYICRDCNGIALQFTGGGRSVQVEDGQEDVFATKGEAENALHRADETGGTVEYRTAAAEGQVKP